MSTLTLATVRAELAPLRMAITHDRDTGEYRVWHLGLNARRAERSAYYTPDLGDALATGIHMAHANRFPMRDRTADWLDGYARSGLGDPLAL